MTGTPDHLTETPFSRDAVPGPHGRDVLSDILRQFRVTSAEMVRAEFGAPWAVTAQPAAWRHQKDEMAR
jgi:hypothetical protein